MFNQPKPPEFGTLVINESRALNSIWFAWLDSEPLTYDQMQQKQAEAGFLPMGYGFYNPKIQQQADGNWLSTWSCASSAD